MKSVRKIEKKHEKMVWFQSSCHPEPVPELDSGSVDFGISLLGLENFGLKPRHVGGVIYFGLLKLEE